MKKVQENRGHSQLRDKREKAAKRMGITLEGGAGPDAFPGEGRPAGQGNR